MFNPDFSIIVPIYNAEKYLEETIACILGQDHGFSEHVELILVNDGSIDRSEEICLSYKEKYPENIQYIKKKNGGASSARNMGIEIARGKFLWFLDGDDLLSSNALRAAYNFFAESKNLDAAFVCLRTILTYEKFDKNHPLDFRFQKGERLIDLANEPQCSATMMGDKCFQREAVGEIRFDENIRINEDTDFSYRVLMNSNLTYGVIPGATYFYRKHEDAITTPRGNEHAEEFLRCQFESLKKLVCLSRGGIQQGPVDLFIQYTILYLMATKRYRHLEIKSAETNHLVYELISACDDSVIAQSKRFSPEQKMLLLDMKYEGEEWQKKCRLEGGELWLGNSRIAKISTWLRVTLLNISELPNKDLEFTLKLPVMKYQVWGLGEIFFTYDGRELQVVDRRAANDMDVQLFGRASQTPTICKVVLPKKIIMANPGVRFKAKTRFTNFSEERETIELSMPRMQMMTNLPNGGPLPWVNTGNYVVKTYKRGMGYVVLRQTAEELEKTNATFMDAIRREWSFLKFYSLTDVANAEEDIHQRILELPLERRRIIRSKEIWIIHGLPNVGSGCAETLYKYLLEHHARRIKPYLVLSKEDRGLVTDEWERMKDEGFNLIDYGSREHMKYLIRAQVVVSMDSNEILDVSLASRWLLYASMFGFKGISIGDVPDCFEQGRRGNPKQRSVELWMRSLRKIAK